MKTQLKNAKTKAITDKAITKPKGQQLLSIYDYEIPKLSEREREYFTKSTIKGDAFIVAYVCLGVLTGAMGYLEMVMVRGGKLTVGLLT